MVNLMVRFAKVYFSAIGTSVKIAAVIASVFMGLALAEYDFSSASYFKDPEFLVAYLPMLLLASAYMFLIFNGIGAVISVIYSADVISRNADLPRQPHRNLQVAVINRLFDQIIEAAKR
jgi:hypothetical protein